jgi:uncharacterized protein YcbK (DUF882 family)
MNRVRISCGFAIASFSIAAQCHTCAGHFRCLSYIEIYLMAVRTTSILGDAYNKVGFGKRPTLLKKHLLFSFVVALAFSFVPVAKGEEVATPADSTPYRLRLYHLHTGEHLDVVYRVGDQYLPDAVAALDHFLRDHRTGDEKDYDIREFDLLHDLLAKLGHLDREIDIVCGYRTPWSNNYLREHSNGVALHSQHMEAKAIDIRIPGIPTAEVRDAALSLKRGGVGYYAQSDFVHVDVGPVRRW